MGRRTLLLLASILVAAAGTALIWVYVQSADTRARSDWHDTVTVLVATAAIDPGASSDAVRQVTKLVPVPRAVAPADAVTDLRSLTGRLTTVSILGGQFIQLGQFRAVGSTSGVSKGKQAVTVNLEDPNRVAGLLRPDTHVAIYYLDLTGARSRAHDGSATVLLPDVRVLAVGSTTTVRNARGQAAQVGTASGVAAANVTLEVDDSAQAMQLMLATSKGTLWFTVLGDGAKASNGDGNGMAGDQLPIAGR